MHPASSRAVEAENRQRGKIHELEACASIPVRLGEKVLNPD
jgi:hypothetical protein